MDPKNLSEISSLETNAPIDRILSPDVTSILIGSVLSLLITISIIGNFLVCIAVGTDRNLRKLSNLFLVSLAIADLLVATVVMPFALINDLSSGDWNFGSTFCKIWISSDVMCCTASITNLCAISLDRYIHIKDPLQYTEWITRKSVPLSIGCLWAISALISFLPISLDLHKASNSYQSQEQCFLDFSPLFSIVSSFISFFLPCIIMLGIYYRLYSFAQYHMKTIKAHTRPLLRLKNYSAPPGNGENNGVLILTNHRTSVNKEITSTINAGQDNTGRRKFIVFEYLSKKIMRRRGSLDGVVDTPLLQEHKAAVTIGIIMGVFLFCWTPFFVVNVVWGICRECVSPTVFKVFTWLGYSNSAFNPVIYSIFNSEFREAFRRILTTSCCRKWSIGEEYYYRGRCPNHNPHTQRKTEKIYDI